MQELINLYKKSKHLHHAYFFVGEVDILELKNFLEKSVGVKTSGNPDFWHGKFDSLSIDEARKVGEASQRKDFGSNIKVFVIEANNINHEAQNSLLKVFEEPTAGTHFFIISPQDVLLPTLRSRVQVIKLDQDEEEKTKNILNKSLKDRLVLVKEITDGISDEEKTKQDAISFLNQIEKELHEKGVEKSAKQLEVCYLTRASLYDRGAPIKIILENLMLSV